MKPSKFGVQLVLLCIMFFNYEVDVFCTHVYNVVFDLSMYEMLVLELTPVELSATCLLYTSPSPRD